MMQELRERTKIVMIVVALAFVGLMVFEWGMDITGRSSAAQTGELGRVNGQPVPYEAYSAVYQQLYNQAQQQNGGESLTRDQVRALEDAAFEQVVNDILVQQELEARGIDATREEIRLAAQWNPHPDLMQNEIFQTDGRFDIRKYQEFLSSPSANEQLLLQLEQYYREQIPRTKLLRRVTAGVFASDAELWRLWRDRNETATADYVTLSLSQLVPGEVEVTDGEIREYYEAHAEEFDRGATARLNLAILSKRPSAADTAEALERAQELRTEIAGGADFAEVAERESADEATAPDGGDLGFFTRGQMVESFDRAAFSLPVGEVSDPILSQFGYHLIQVRERQGDSVRASHILVPAERSEAALDRLYARADSLESLAARGGAVRAARAMGLEAREGVVVSEDEPFVSGVGSALDAVDWARDVVEEATEERVSPLFETPEAFYIADLQGFTPPGRVPLQDATPQIRRDLILEKKRERARQIGDQIAAEVRAGQKTLEAAAEERGLTVETTGPFSRLGMNPVFGQASPAVGAAFGLPVGQVSDVVEGASNLYIVRPTERTTADRDEFEARKASFRQMVVGQLQQEAVDRWIRSVRERAEVTDHRAEVLTRS